MQENIPSTIVGQAVETQLEGGAKSAEEVTKGVQDQIKEDVAELQATYGDSVNDVCKDAIAQAESYSDARGELLQGFDVEDLSSKGAAGICDKSDDSVAVDKTLLEVGATPEEERKKLEYLEGVTDHEKVHRDEQAATFTADEIVTRDGTVITIKDAFEGHAIDEAGQNIEDLTPEYRVHHDQYLKLASIVTKEKIKKALKSGDMIGVQIAALAA